VASHSPLETKLTFRRPPPLSSEQFLLSLGSPRPGFSQPPQHDPQNAGPRIRRLERHLAQLESGEGNISILLLRRIAAVLSVSLEELFAPQRQDNQQGEQQHASQKQNVFRFIERLPSHRLEEAARTPHARFWPGAKSAP